MNKKAFQFPTGVGVSSLVVIFAVLCMSVFGVLSLSEAQTQNALGEKNRQHIENYYKADCRAQEILAKLRMGEVPPGVIGENGSYSYYCEISDTQTLWVQVKLEDGNYDIQRWQTVSSVQWQPEKDFPVWQGKE